MTRHISFFCIVDNEPRFLDGLISDYLDYRMNKYYTALVVGGCGMDMAFSVVNHLQVQMTTIQTAIKPIIISDIGSFNRGGRKPPFFYSNFSRLLF